MCGRFALHHPADEIHEAFNIERPIFLSEPRYNIAPTQSIAVVTPARELVEMRWGLVPRWSRDGKPYINARGETLAEKPSFREAFRKRRVIVPCSGFYEWRAEGKLRVPLYIRVDGGALFGIAALWEPPAEPGGLPTVALVTTAANAALAPLHDRMPVIVARAHHAAWLDPANPAPEALITAYPAEAFTLHTVSSRVNGVKDDDAGIIEPERRGLFG
jgi:putative SOS response-associated peptidase YedK